MRIHALAILCAGLVCMPSAMGQGVTVQQPAVGVFSVDTVVSVPDRGAAFLGGVRSAGGSWSSAGFGPFRSSAFGGFSSGSSADARVFIHDFEAMDEELLGRPVSQPAATARRSYAHAEDDWLFSQRHRPVVRPGAAAGGGWPNTSPPTPERVASSQGPPQTSDPSRLAEFYLSRGRDAEALGKTGAAALCYKMAVKYGSRGAEGRLAVLNQGPVP